MLYYYFIRQVVALLFGLIYLRQTYDQKGIMNINGSLFLLQAQMTFGTLFAVLSVSRAQFECPYNVCGKT